MVQVTSKSHGIHRAVNRAQQLRLQFFAATYTVCPTHEGATCQVLYATW